MITRKQAKLALERRNNHKPKPIELDPNFIKQNAFIQSDSRYLVAQCSRRSGKTNGLAIRFFKTMEKHPRSQSLYLSLTQDSARSIMWPVLQELNTIHNLGCEFVESKLTMTHPNGATLKLMGADLKDFIKRLKGRKYPGIAIDEAQDFGGHLQSLVDDVLTPSIADYEDGWLALTGTPGPVPQGYFFDITQNRKFGYDVHEWTLLENPYMPNPVEFIADLKKKREWDDNNPTLLREWRNKWVLDVQALWVVYNEEKDHYAELPKYKEPWNYIMGIDLGFKDADAIAILAWHDKDPNTYLVEEYVASKQGITELVNKIQEFEKKYNVSKMVIDEGGLGKKIAEELRRQKGIPVHQADKARKQEAVAFLNDALRVGRFKAHKESRFVLDSYLIQIDWDKSTHDRIVLRKKVHSDIIDAVLYAFRESPAFAYEEPKKEHPVGTPEWSKDKDDEMFSAAMEFFRAKEENEGSGGDFNY